MGTIALSPHDLSQADLVGALRRMRPELARLGVTGLSLFGSRARGDQRADSDIDLLVDVEEGRKFSLLDLISVTHAIEDEMGLSANLVMRRSLDAAFIDEVRRDELVVFGGP